MVSESDVTQSNINELLSLDIEEAQKEAEIGVT